MKKLILLILLPVIISGCTLIPKKNSQQNNERNVNTTVNSINSEIINQNNSDVELVKIEKLKYLGYGYYTDEKNIYYALWSPKNNNYANYYDINFKDLFEIDKPVIVNDADLLSFQPIYKACRIGGCDGVAKDKNNVYRGASLINLNEQIDVKTFEYVDYVYFKDKNAIYYTGYGGMGRAGFVDINTFEALSDIYSKDKNNVYTMGNDVFEILKGADPKTFVVPNN